MVEFHGSVSHRLARSRTLAQWQAGRLETQAVCDADFLLVSAARFHGTRTTQRCPICEAEGLYHVLWIYGEQLGRMSGSARTAAEIEAFTLEGREFTVHTVEVCEECKWNHLLQTTIAAPTVQSHSGESLSGLSRYNSADDKINPTGLYCMAFFEEDF